MYVIVAKFDGGHRLYFEGGEPDAFTGAIDRAQRFEDDGEAARIARTLHTPTVALPQSIYVEAL